MITADPKIQTDPNLKLQIDADEQRAADLKIAGRPCAHRTHVEYDTELVDEDPRKLIMRFWRGFDTLRTMNFLERLVADWYEHQGYLVRSNLMFGKPDKGGYEGEADVLAVKFDEHRLVHIETSGDAFSWEKRLSRFEGKFKTANKYYLASLSIPKDFTIERRVYVGFGSPSAKTRALIEDFEARVEARVYSVDELAKEIVAHVGKSKPETSAIPESFGYLRAFQFAVWFGSDHPKFLKKGATE